MAATGVSRAPCTAGLFGALLDEQEMGPFSIVNLGLVESFVVRVGDAVGNLTFEPVFDMRTSGLQSRNPVNDVDGEVEAVHLIAYHELQRRVDIAFFLISADVYVGVFVRRYVNL